MTTENFETLKTLAGKKKFGVIQCVARVVSLSPRTSQRRGGERQGGTRGASGESTSKANSG